MHFQGGHHPIPLYPHPHLLSRFQSQNTTLLLAQHSLRVLGLLNDCQPFAHSPALYLCHARTGCLLPVHAAPATSLCGVDGLIEDDR